MKNILLYAIFSLSIFFCSCSKDESVALQIEPDMVEEVEPEIDDTMSGDETPEEEAPEEETPEPDDNQAPAEVEQPQMGQVSYQGRIPSENSKVPSCKSGTPDSIMFVMTDEAGTTRTESVPASEDNGVVTTLISAPMPLGTSTVNEILLMNGNDTLYAIPSVDDLDLERFADVTVPFEVEVLENTQLAGSAFCFTNQPIDLPDDALIDGGFGTQRLQTLWIDVKGECIDTITVTIDANRVLEIFPFEDGLYDIPVPENYGRMDVRAYTPDFQSGVNEFQLFNFSAENPYNSDGVLNVEDVLQFSYDCPLEEFPDDDI